MTRIAELITKEAVEEAVAETEKRKSVELAKKMLSKNKPIEEIIEFTELTKQEIKNIQKTLNK